VRPDDPAAAYARLRRGEDAIAALRVWIDKYDVQCMRCAA
jgi:glycine cleavage system H protein